MLPERQKSTKTARFCTFYYAYFFFFVLFLALEKYFLLLLIAFPSCLSESTVFFLLFFS